MCHELDGFYAAAAAAERLRSRFPGNSSPPGHLSNFFGRNSGPGVEDFVRLGRRSIGLERWE